MAAIKERLEARISREQKQLLHEAAQLRGQSLTEFVVSSAQEAARRTIEERNLVRLTRRDSEVFARALMDPPAAGTTLNRAVKRYRQRTTG